MRIVFDAKRVDAANVFSIVPVQNYGLVDLNFGYIDSNAIYETERYTMHGEQKCVYPKNCRTISMSPQVFMEFFSACMKLFDEGTPQ